MASRPHPPVTIGPLYVRASVAPEMADLPVDIFWSLVLPEGAGASDAEGDLFLLWPSALIPVPNLGQPDPTVTRYVEERGFASIEEGRLELSTRKLSAQDRKWEAIPGGAPFTTFVRQGGALGLTSPASYVRIPWTPKLVEPGWLMRLSMKTKGLIKPKPSTWTERAFWGPRSRLLLSFQDVNARGLFPLYFERRAHVVRLAEDPAQLRIDFSKADHLKIDELQPPASRRQLGEPGKRTLVYRSRRMAPQRGRSWGWIATVDHWEEENQEVDIPLVQDVVSDVQARVRRTRLAHPDAE